MESVHKEVDVNRIRDLIGNLSNLNTKEEYLEKVYQIFEIYGLGHGCLQVYNHELATVNGIWRAMPDSIAEICTQVTLSGSHPAVKLSKNRNFPFDLFDFKQHFEDEDELNTFYSELEKHGFDHVYGLPIHTGESIFVFIVARHEARVDTVELLTLQAICSNAVNNILKLEPNPVAPDKPCKLTENERIALISIAKGDSIPAAATRLELSEMTMNLIVEGAIEKLGARNTSHAILLSIIEGEFGLSDCISLPHDSIAN